MQRFEADQLKRFLQTVDSHLDQAVELTVIGGTAALLAYGAKRTKGPRETRLGSHEDGPGARERLSGSGGDPPKLSSRLQRVDRQVGDGDDTGHWRS